MVKMQFRGGRNLPTKPQLMRRLAKAGIGLIMAVVTAPLNAAEPALIPAPPIVRATPAMWEIHDADTTIYLFGTFHTLDDRTVWFTDNVRAAFNRSGELVLETIVPADPNEIRAKAQATVNETGRDGRARLKPFIAQTQAVVSDGRRHGLSVDNGADAVLRRVADEVGKPVAGLEAFEQQLRALARIPAAPPPALAIAATPAPVSLNDLLSAWKNGDADAFSTMLAGFEAKSPIAYRMLIADRNARWGEWISRRLDQPGTVFVAVGSGHLAGKDSVQAWLAARGIAATRVE